MMKNKQMYGASCLCGCKEGIWFVHNEITVLLFYSFEEEKVSFYRRIPCDNIISSIAFSACVYTDGYIWLFSNNQNKSFVYDINKDNFITLEIENSCCNSFRGAVLYGKEILVIPYKYDRLIKISTADFTVNYLDRWKSLFEGCSDDYINSFSYDGKNRVAMSVPGHNDFLVYDLKTSKLSKIKTYDKDADYTQIGIFEDMFIAFDRKTKKVESINLDGNILNNILVEYSSTKLTTIGNNIILDVLGSDDIYIFSKDLKCKNEYKLTNNKNNFETDMSIILDWFKCENNAYYGVGNSNDLICIDELAQFTTKTLEMDDSLFETFTEDIIRNNTEILLENEMIGLEQFINCL